MGCGPLGPHPKGVQKGVQNTTFWGHFGYPQKSILSLILRVLVFLSTPKWCKNVYFDPILGVFRSLWRGPETLRGVWDPIGGSW